MKHEDHLDIPLTSATNKAKEKMKERRFTASPMPRLISSDDSDDDVELFNALARGGSGGVSVENLYQLIKGSGTESILSQILKKLDKFPKGHVLAQKTFYEVIDGYETTLWRATSGSMVIPNWEEFTDEITEIYKEVEKCNWGKVATYIPELAEVDPNYYAISVCSIDGQQFNLGDFDSGFCIQSCSKPISYLMAVEQNGSKVVHQHIGREPSGNQFNDLKLRESNDSEADIKQVPHNPMINSGAIMSVSMIERGKPMAHRFRYYKSTWERLCGQSKLGFQNSTYLSEKDTADRNYCLAYMMRESGAFPKNTNLSQTLDLYFQTCSIEATCNQMAIMGSSLANGGTCPTTQDQIFRPEHVRDCLSLMLSCGMYDYSGEWAFKVGIPAKSGVGGSVIIVIPNVCGICVWSPRLDKHGNSVKGVEFARRLIDRFNFHHYENLRGILRDGKKDPTLQISFEQTHVLSLLAASAKGEVREVMRLVAAGCPIYSCDYDHRTALHIAASEHHEEIVRYLVYRPDGTVCSKKYLNMEDRWGDTALDNAIDTKAGHIVKILEKAGGTRGSRFKSGSERHIVRCGRRSRHPSPGLSPMSSPHHSPRESEGDTSSHSSDSHEKEQKEKEQKEIEQKHTTLNEQVSKKISVSIDMGKQKKPIQNLEKKKNAKGGKKAKIVVN